MQNLGQDNTLSRVIKVESDKKMLRKKNYKKEDHFTEYQTFSLPLVTGKKVIIYYKRYRPKIATTDKVTQIYEMINSKNKLQQQQLTKAKSPYPIDRTLQLITFDQDLQNKIEPVMKKVGKVRKFQFGKGEFKNREVFFCMVIFKYEFDLVKCFREQYIQSIIQEHFKFHQKQQDKEDYRAELISTYLQKQLESKSKKIKELHDQGFNLITNKSGQFYVDRQANQKWVQELPQVKKQKKLQQFAQDTSKTKLQ